MAAPKTLQPLALQFSIADEVSVTLLRDSTQAPDEMATALYSAFSTTLKQRFAGWQVYLFTADLSLPKMLRLKESRKTPFFNGALECRLFRFEMVAGFNRREEAKPKQADTPAS